MGTRLVEERQEADQEYTRDQPGTPNDPSSLGKGQHPHKKHHGPHESGYACTKGTHYPPPLYFAFWMGHHSECNLIDQAIAQ